MNSVSLNECPLVCFVHFFFLSSFSSSHVCIMYGCVLFCAVLFLLLFMCSLSLGLLVLPSFHLFIEIFCPFIWLYVLFVFSKTKKQKQKQKKVAVVPLVSCNVAGNCG